MGEWLKKFYENVKKDKKRSLLMLVLVGILILVIAWPVSDRSQSGGEGGSAAGAQGASTGNGQGSGNGAGQSSGSGAANGSGDLTYAATADGNLSAGQTLEDYVAAAEARLTELLSCVEGAGNVQVMITAHATREKVVGKDVNETASKVTENDSSGGTRVTDESSYGETALYGGGTSGQDSGEPYIIKELTPEIEGVVVAAEGAGDEYIVDEITQAVSVLFNLPVHKIKVVKMES